MVAIETKRVLNTTETTSACSKNLEESNVSTTYALVTTKTVPQIAV
jgi:hypothetical protein